MIRAMVSLVLVSALNFFAAPGLAQTAQAPPCSGEEFRQFDFWLGDWDLSWQGGSGTNSITAPLGDCVIQESFSGDMGGPKPFIGISVSSYSPLKEKWEQTWVDNSGGYLTFTGGLEGDDMILYGEGVQNGTKFLTRMIFTDIKENSLTWHWERSNDDGENWQSQWVINYVRRGESE